MAKQTIPTSGLWGTIAGLLNGNFNEPDICRIGWYNYSDTATGTTPISLTANTPAYLTNDGAGSLTQSAPVSDVTDAWDTVAQSFDFSELSNGDMVNIRVDAQVTTTSANQQVDLVLELGIGGFNYDIPFASGQFKNAGTKQVNRYNFVAIFDDNTRLNEGKFRIVSDSSATVTVLGWLVKIERRGL